MTVDTLKNQDETYEKEGGTSINVDHHTVYSTPYTFHHKYSGTISNQNLKSKIQKL